MPKPMQLNHTCTLVTGASAGLGREILRLIVKEQGGQAIAVARRRDRLDELARELQVVSANSVEAFAADLSSREDVERCFVETTRARRIDGIILNAGVTYYGKVAEQSIESIENIISTNAFGLTVLAAKFAKYFVDQKIPGRILLVSSMTGFSPMPYQAVYAGTKAYVTNFGLSLREELRGTGISVTVFCPGGIATEMLDKSGLSRRFKPDDFGMMDATTCAKHALAAFLSGRDLAVPGVGNWVGSVAQRLAPRGLLARAVERLYRGGINPSSS
jgi:short-subunit dehydrogenase